MLAHLPTELRLAILELLEPEECFDFAVTSKLSWEISEPLIQKYRKLFEELRIVATKRDERTVWNLLDRILDEPSAADYVREIQLDADRALCYDLEVKEPYALTSESEQVSPENAARYDEACEQFCDSWRWQVPRIDRYLNIGDDWVVEEEIKEEIIKGSDGPIVPILLCMLPRLHTLRYTAGGDDYWLLHALRCIVEDAELGDNIAPPFRSLRNVSITHYGTEGHMRWAWVHCIIRIPSLRSFTGNMIGGRWDDFIEEDEYLLDGTTAMSGVTDLTFGNSSVEAIAMDATVTQCRNLRTFRYQNGGSLVGPDAYDPRHFIGTLWLHYRHTVEQLILDDDSDENRAEDIEDHHQNHPVHSLRGFEKLKSFACDLKDIVTANDKDMMKELKEEEFQEGITIRTNNSACIFNVRALFPESLEELHIGCNDLRVSLKDRLALLNELLKSKERVLPHLRRVYMPVQESAELEEFKASAAAAGVEYRPNPLMGAYGDVYCSVW